MRRPVDSAAVGLVCLAVVLGCGSSEQPEAYPGQPINPPSKQDDLLDMMTGTGSVASTDVVAPGATAAAAATVTVTATAAATAAPTAKPKQPKATATAAPKATATAAPKATATEMAPKK